MPTTPDPQSLPRHILALKEKILALDLFRPGSLTGRYRKCGKPNCHCAKDGAPGHGPSWSLTRAIDGKTKTTIIPDPAVESVKTQIANHKQFQHLVKELVEANVQLSDLQISQPDDREAPEKKRTRH